MEEYVLEGVSEGVVGSGTAVWHVLYRKPDKTIHQHTILKEAVNWRMAEYELTDIDEAMDMLLHEPWVRDDDDTDIPGALRATADGREVPVGLYTAGTVQEAREAHQRRVAYVKQFRRRVANPMAAAAKDGNAIDPLDVMRKTHVVTVEDVAEKRIRVRALRQGFGLDSDKPRAIVRQPSDDVIVPVNDADVRREKDRRSDRTDALYGSPLPKGLRLS